jgi:hypothetical protein
MLQTVSSQCYPAISRLKCAELRSHRTSLSSSCEKRCVFFSPFYSACPYNEFIGPKGTRYFIFVLEIHGCSLCLVIFFHIHTVDLDIIKAFYSTDAQVNCLKNNFKFTLKLTIKQPRHVSVQSVTPSSGSALLVLAKVTVVKIAS